MPFGQPRLRLVEPEFLRREEVEEGTGDGVLDLEEKVAEGLELVENVPVALHAQEGRRSPRTPDISKVRQKIATRLRVQRQNLIFRRFDAFKAWAVHTETFAWRHPWRPARRGAPPRACWWPTRAGEPSAFRNDDLQRADPTKFPGCMSVNLTDMTRRLAILNTAHGKSMRLRLCAANSNASAHTSLRIQIAAPRGNEMADAAASNLTSATTVQELAREPGNPDTDWTLPFFFFYNSNSMPRIYFARMFDEIQNHCGTLLVHLLASIQKMSCLTGIREHDSNAKQ